MSHIHSELENESSAIILPVALSDRALRNLWIAVRGEYIAFSGGRERFADYVQEKVASVENSQTFTYSDGSKVPNERHYPTPQTYYNFFRGGTGKFRLPQSQNAQGLINANPRTLRVLLKFLFGVRGEGVAEILTDPGMPWYHEFVDNLDGNFLICDPKEILPESFALFRPPAERHMRTIQAFISDYERGNYGSCLEARLKAHSLVSILSIEPGRSVVDIVSADTFSSFGDGRRTEASTEVINASNFRMPMGSIAFRSMDYVPSNTQPFIIQSQFHLVARFYNCLTRDAVSCSLSFDPNNFAEQIESADLVGLSISLSKFVDVDGTRAMLIPSSLSTEDRDRLHDICKLPRKVLF